MTRDDYNKGKKPKPEVEATLCTWNHCETCINTRTRQRMPIPELRTYKNTPPYFRYLNPERRGKFYRDKQSNTQATHSTKTI